MPLKQIKPTSPARRQQTYPDFAEITRSEPEKALTTGKKRISGRNNKGRVTVRFRGGGHKRRYREIDFRRDKLGVPGRVASIEYDPNRSARIALVHYADGEKRYILWPVGLEVGAEVVAGEDAPVNVGNALPLRKMPLGTILHNMELKVGKGGQMVRSAGSLGAVDGARGQLRAGAPALERGAAGARRLLRDRRSGRQRRARERLARQGRSQALAGAHAAQPRRGDESGRSPDGRRRGAHLGRPSPRDAVGQADQGVQDAQQQAHHAT